MTSLNVIALISGGKDSFYSILHCLENGHRVLALGNLYPGPSSGAADFRVDDENDLNSFMYQTVGHNVIPLYEEALGIPLYRQQIVGDAVQTGSTYSNGGTEDETESLVPLLKRIMTEHPIANAISTGAILSTYQRTRVESVALRLGLLPLSYLWKYPVLPPGSQTSLLQDMQAVELDARIIKVASGGLDESFLWANVANGAVIVRIEKSMKRFGMDSNGAVLGEGGEFETLVLGGPSPLFKKQIEILEEDRRIIREGGGSAWLRITKAGIVDKKLDASVVASCRTPELLEKTFASLLTQLNTRQSAEKAPRVSTTSTPDKFRLFEAVNPESRTLYWTFLSQDADSGIMNIESEASQVVANIISRLKEHSLQTTDIVSTMIVLRSMQDFASVNKIYGSLFPEPNPPARVTIACGDTLPENTNIIIHLKVQNASGSVPRKALHVQSRSYWAPANIGPYSQAISNPLLSSDIDANMIWVVSVAGQIPLIPATMVLPPPSAYKHETFSLQATLSLQHLWRIGIEMSVTWWTSAVAYVPSNDVTTVREQARIAARAWSLIHAPSPDEDEDDDTERDLWEEKHNASMETHAAIPEAQLPDWDLITVSAAQKEVPPPFFAVEIEELPRDSSIEWHAHLGVSGAPIFLDSQQDSGGAWKIHRCIIGKMMQIVVEVAFTEGNDTCTLRTQQALEEVGHKAQRVLSYIDASLYSVGDYLRAGVEGVVPCRSIWDSDGGRLSAVFLLEIM